MIELGLSDDASVIMFFSVQTSISSAKVFHILKLKVM